ncbi:uncharacterized protein BO97DRAFT_217226 [Aspergillus homomorphus CBS 101889]|uniref:Uncharacterized protein n=1 Tax=Aspergillus homomorphus (strain CBS 101889) TaxID=1450537 RepID=A0A395I6U8_ASPHC|nr:hypothetical protein BO97DRAFT_217226 [Aspergillus homomorphus CBS 101889]RAL15596.1 hypothetical protein BO97DRAFT_217226 [Aspergillus homomorphus CBS 101889]
MARLCIPGLPFRKDPAPTASRIKSQPAFASFHHLSRVTFRRNVPCYAPRPLTYSHVPTPSPRTAVRVFQEIRKGSNLPVRSQVRTSSSRSPTVVGPAAVSRTSVRQAAQGSWAPAQSTTKPPLPLQPEPASTPAAYVKMTAREMVARIDAVLARSAATREGATRAPVSCLSAVRKDKSKKRVRFCETTEVLTVPRWIERKEHAFPGPLSCLGHLQAWKVTPLHEPDEDGEMEKYTTYWGSESYAYLSTHDATSPGDRYLCAWNSLAWVRAKRPAWDDPMVFSGWLDMRAKLRGRGHFRL